jgi:hypothetical protein
MIEALPPRIGNGRAPSNVAGARQRASRAAIARMRANVRRSVFSQWLTFSRLRQKYCGAILKLAPERGIPWIVSR